MVRLPKCRFEGVSIMNFDEQAYRRVLLRDKQEADAIRELSYMLNQQFTLLGGSMERLLGQVAQGLTFTPHFLIWSQDKGMSKAYDNAAGAANKLAPFAFKSQKAMPTVIAPHLQAGRWKHKLTFRLSNYFPNGEVGLLFISRTGAKKGAKIPTHFTHDGQLGSSTAFKESLIEAIASLGYGN